MRNHLIDSNLREKGVYFISPFQVMVRIWGKLRKKPEPGGRNWSMDYGGTRLAVLILGSPCALFLIQPRHNCLRDGTTSSGLNSLISMSNEENVPQTWLPASVRDLVPQWRIALPSGVKMTLKINHDTHLKTEAKERSPSQPENDNDTLKQPEQLPWGLTSPYDGMSLVPFRVQREL